MLIIPQQYVIVAIAHNKWRLISMNEKGTIEVIETNREGIMDFLKNNLALLAIVKDGL